MRMRRSRRFLQLRRHCTLMQMQRVQLLLMRLQVLMPLRLSRMQLAHRRPSKLLILPKALHQQAVHLLGKQHCRRGRLLRRPPLRSIQVRPVLRLQSCQQWNLLLLPLRQRRNPSLFLSASPA